MTGVDPDRAMLAAARSRVAKAGVQATFLEGRVERLPFPDSTFDVVVSVTVLCFVADAGGAVRTNQMGRVEGDFEKGVADGAQGSLKVISQVARRWRDGARP